MAMARSCPQFRGQQKARHPGEAVGRHQAMGSQSKRAFEQSVVTLYTPAERNESERRRRYRVLDEQLQKFQAQGVTPGQWKTERNRLQAEAEREMQALWERVSRVLETSNKEFAKWERYCREQGRSVTRSGGSGSARANDVRIG